ncbi:uncharacterized protein C9orf85 [Caerostris darwini]|uniref:Uncharacterized protein C9orf85 n=1 Tax=Caerostris darwini TaxID=1538125 RepID=A0AAV4SEC2_9ARAC|nr:uncharacterized protein C9orf85 [Caerostris darwini]
MSSQKGNVSRTRSQKHKNCIQFKNDKFDKSQQTKMLNNMKLTSLCSKCEAIIAWKIKYKKYKPLSAPAKCVKCEQKTVKAAYHVICTNCSEEEKICAKCLEIFENNET